MNTTTALPVPLELPAEMCRKEAFAPAVQAPFQESATEADPAAPPTNSVLAIGPVTALPVIWKLKTTVLGERTLAGS